jgi:predicted dehydrogenase
VLRHAKYLLEKRAIGRLQFMRCYSYASDIFRKGSGWRFKKGTGGVLLDLGPHLLDLLLWYFGEPEVISAIEQSYYSSEVEDYVHAVFRFGADFVGSFDVSWSKRHYRLPEISIEVQGTAGSLSVCDDYVRIQADKSVEGVIEAGSKTFQRAAFDTGVQFLLADPEYTVEDIHFLDAVQNRTKVEPDFQTAAEVSQLIDQVHQVASRSEC